MQKHAQRSNILNSCQATRVVARIACCSTRHSQWQLYSRTLHAARLT
jgi:hypothetical protein